MNRVLTLQVNVQAPCGAPPVPPASFFPGFPSLPLHVPQPPSPEITIPKTEVGEGTFAKAKFAKAELLQLHLLKPI